MEARITTCAWCGLQVGENAPVFGIGAKVRSQDSTQDKEGTFLPFYLELTGKTVYGAVVTGDSEAKRHGWDLMFLACSPSCIRALQKALREELGIATRRLN